jgi:hypothetical protein
MKTVNLRRYSEPDTLREISPRTLVALMDEHREFLGGKGVTLPPIGSRGPSSNLCFKVSKLCVSYFRLVH